MAFRLAVGGCGWGLNRDRNGWISINPVKRVFVSYTLHEYDLLF